jgi:hypothetical protein
MAAHFGALVRRQQHIQRAENRQEWTTDSGQRFDWLVLAAGLGEAVMAGFGAAL